MNVNICPSLLVFTCCLGAKINVNIFPQILICMLSRDKNKYEYMSVESYYLRVV